MLFDHPDPDFERLRKVLLRQGRPDRVPFVELFADREIMQAVVAEPFPRPDPDDRQLQEIVLRRAIRFWYETGYDYITVVRPSVMAGEWVRADDTAALPHDRRGWKDGSTDVISNWEDFEAYPWPGPEEVDYYGLEYVWHHLPDGMQVIYLGPGGVLENMMWLMGYVPLALALKDDRGLVEAVAQKVGELLISIFSTAAEMPGVGAL